MSPKPAVPESPGFLHIFHKQLCRRGHQSPSLFSFSEDVGEACALVGHDDGRLQHLGERSTCAALFSSWVHGLQRQRTTPRCCTKKCIIDQRRLWPILAQFGRTWLASTNAVRLVDVATGNELKLFDGHKEKWVWLRGAGIQS